MRFFPEEQVRQLTDVDEVIRGLRAAFARDFASTLLMPVRTSLPIAGGVLLLMPAFDSAMNAAGVKIVTVTGAGVNAAYEFLDATTGQILARMEANWLTDVRTAAASAVATDLLARPDAEVLGVFGCGRQAAAHLAVLPRVRKFRRLLVCGKSHTAAATFCAKLKQERGIQPEPVDAETCVRESHVICTCTTSRVPLFAGRILRAGTHLNLVGAFQPESREIDDETARRSRIVVDTYDGALNEAGDILVPLQSGVINKQQIVADLHEICSGKKQGRVTPDDVTMFKSVGCALEDLVTAQLIYSRAEGPA